MDKPALYLESNAITRKVVDDLFNEFIGKAGNMTGRCIDIGSGPGDVVADLILPKLSPDATIVCADVSENMVNFAKERYGNNSPRMSFIQLNIDAPNIPQDLVGQFHLVTSSYCLHYCRDMRRTFGNIFNLLRPGGSAFVTFIAKSPAMDGLIKLAAMPRWQPYMKDVDRYITLFQRAEKPRDILEAILEDVGFEVQHCSIRERSWIYNSREEFSRLMVALNSFIDRMPVDIREEYEKDLVRVTAERNVIFNKHHENEDEYSVLFIQHVFVLFLKKPLTG